MTTDVSRPPPSIGSAPTRTRIAVREATAALRAGRLGGGEALDPDQAAAVQGAVSEHLRESAALLAPTVGIVRQDSDHLAALAVVSDQLRILAEVSAPLDDRTTGS